MDFTATELRCCKAFSAKPLSGVRGFSVDFTDTAIASSIEASVALVSPVLCLTVDRTLSEAHIALCCAASAAITTMLRRPMDFTVLHRNSPFAVAAFATIALVGGLSVGRTAFDRIAL